MGDQLGAPIAELFLGLWALLTTALAVRLRRKARRESTRADDAEQQRDYWREQSLRPPAHGPSPGGVVELEGLEALGRAAREGESQAVTTPDEAVTRGRVAKPPGPLHGAEELPEAGGTRWVELAEDEAPEGPGEAYGAPGQFADEPTDPQKRKPS